jgi:hypothetical protein
VRPAPPGANETDPFLYSTIAHNDHFAFAQVCRIRIGVFLSAKELETQKTKSPE